MTKFKIYRFDGNVSKYITSIDDTKENVREKVKEMNKEIPIKEQEKGYGYYSEKAKEY